MVGRLAKARNLSERKRVNNAKRLDKKAAQLLIALTVCLCVLVTTATCTYCYPETMGALALPFMWMHNISGDIALLITGAYLIGHLARTWKMRRMKFNRYSGIIGVALWVIAGASGIYGHFVKLEDHGPMWWIHFLTSMASLILVCMHGAWAFRPRKKVQ